MNTLEKAIEVEKEFKGNWKKFNSFYWSDKLENADEFGIWYTHNRDSDILEETNAKYIKNVMADFCAYDDEDDLQCTKEDHNHWACGWVAGYSIRVRFPNGEFTPAFLKMVELQMRIDEYPILDEDAFSQAEWEAENDPVD